MIKPMSIIDNDYRLWLLDLRDRFRKSQIRAAVKVNQEMLKFYWDLGRDIVKRNAENKYGTGFYKTLSADLTRMLGGAKSFSPNTIRYSKHFYVLYHKYLKNIEQKNLQQFVGNSRDTRSENNPSSKLQQPVGVLQKGGKANDETIREHIITDIFSIPWGHHVLIIDKCGGNSEKAIFYVHQTVENGWSRSMLLNFLKSDLFERSGKAITNFKRTLPAPESDLAQELTRDPYEFAFTGLTNEYNERKLKDALLHNITQFLIELGTGFAYVGKEYRLQIGETENFIDLLFYNLKLSCYVVIEVKIGKFASGDLGQLGTYVVACNHKLCKAGRDNPTIGLLVCREKDNVLAQYALESSSQPIGISEYELSKLYPEKVEGTIPTIEEIEAKLTDMDDD